MNFLDMIDSEIAEQERLLSAHPAFVKLKALRATREAYAVSNSVVAAKSAIAMLPTINTDRQSGFLAGIVSRTRNAPLSGKSLDAVNAVIRVLQVVGEPIKTADLLEIIRKDGIEFSGSAPQNVLSSLLSRSPDVVSKGGHIGWALKEWDTAGGDQLGGEPPPADDETPAQGREAGPGGGT